MSGYGWCIPNTDNWQSKKTLKLKIEHLEDQKKDAINLMHEFKKTLKDGEIIDPKLFDDFLMKYDNITGAYDEHC